MEAFNQALFLIINAKAHPSPAMLLMTTFLAQWLIYGVLPLLAGLWLCGARAHRAAAMTATLSIIFALGCNQLISGLWFHPRPFMIGLGHSFLAHSPEASFPSDHATVIFTLGLAFLQASLRKLGISLVLVGLLVGWARVYLGVHFPLDIAGSLLVSAASARWMPQVLGWRGLGERLFNFLERLFQRIWPTAPRRNCHLKGR